jgi:uncharacterized LabA/DUF88 family protein
MAERVAILVDGGFVRKKIEEGGKTADAAAIVAMIDEVMKKPRLAKTELLRVYFYDSPPFTGSAKNPVDASVINFATTSQAQRGNVLLETLELQPDYAVRRGTLTCSGWKLGRAALKGLSTTSRALGARDLVPDMKQKGVDLRIGLDIALMSLKRLVEVIVLATGDSDLVPAMKFARKEGVRVYLEAMGHAVRRELRVHADFVL